MNTTVLASTYIGPTSQCHCCLQFIVKLHKFKMLNEWLHNLIGRFTRHRLKFIFVGSYDWDPKSRQFILTSKTIHWNGLIAEFYGWLFLLLMFVWLITRFYEEQTFETSMSVASYFTGWTEFSILLMLLLFNRRFDRRRDQVVFTLNQMFNFANTITGIFHNKSYTQYFYSKLSVY